jgi:hypothetical protein
VAPLPGKPSIIVKQTVKQVQSAQNKKRNATVRKTNRTSLAAARKKYTTAKRELTKKIRASKKAEYMQENAKIKSLPAKQRKAARKRVQAVLKTKLQKLLTLMKPSSFYKKIAHVQTGIATLRKIKW